jgi:predicted ester cyclase
MKMIWEAFPDCIWNIEELVAVGDLVVSRTIVRGTHKGTFMDIPPTGNKFELNLINISRLKNGKIVEEREDYDSLGLMQILGMELKPKAPAK